VGLRTTYIYEDTYIYTVAQADICTNEYHTHTEYPTPVCLRNALAPKLLPFKCLSTQVSVNVMWMRLFECATRSLRRLRRRLFVLSVFSNDMVWYIALSTPPISSECYDNFKSHFTGRRKSYYRFSPQFVCGLQDCHL